MTKQRSVWLWFAATSAVFFTRALIYSSILSRGPEIQAALHLDTAQMGFLSMLYPAGGVLGLTFSGVLVSRFGTRKANTATYVLAPFGFIALGTAIDAGSLPLAALCLLLVGLPMAISDFVGNIEGTGVNNASKYSLFTAIHGLFGVGMLVGANWASWMIALGVSISATYWGVGLFVAILSIAAGLAFQTPPQTLASAEEKRAARERTVQVWFEKRSLLIAVIGFSFIMAESSAGTWVPIALTQVGFTGAQAAFAFGIFWIVITIGRLLGGFVVDRLGRRRTILLCALMTAAGILVFMGGQVIHLPYLGLILWGLGMSAGFPLTITAMGDEPKMASARINMIISVVYISSVTVGPALGAVGQSLGLYAAFGIPLVLLLISAAISGVTKPLVVK
jgi:fucose permease